ncbi:MazG family protein [Prescottella soli]|uniref:MazG family protein n=1 Tax=Prescottella soli TaxID=1543852 RepID=A0ABW9FQ89_9NOCA
MTVLLLDPLWPGVVPIEAVTALGGTVEFTDEVPGSVRAYFECGSRPSEVLVSTDAGHPDVVKRKLLGEKVIEAAPRPGQRLVSAVDVMDRLWGFAGWEVTQTHESLRRYLLEETYEVLDAIAEGDADGLREELGDLLLQVLFHSRIAQESDSGAFTVDDVADTLVAKLASRSPHLSNGHSGPIDVAQQETAWQAAKAAEKARVSSLDGIALAQPALALAEKVIDRATRAGLPTELVPHELRTVRVVAGAEESLRVATLRFVAAVRATESAAHAAGVPYGSLTADDWFAHWRG